MSRLYAAIAALLIPTLASALELHLPLGRVAYQTNEDIDLAVVLDGPSAKADEISVTATAEQGGKLAFVFPAHAAKAERRTIFVRLNARLMRPGNYTVEVAAGGETKSAKIEIYSHIRKSSFRLVDWASHAKGEEQAALGEDGMGFNVLLASYGGLSADDAIRAGLDYMWCCTMSGGHQMDLRLECDWSDPLVLRGATARVVRRAFQDRTNPNCIGVHFYDEPGLTWHKHPVTGEFTPHGVPAQTRAYAAAFGKNPPDYSKIDPKNAKEFDDWLHWGQWKLGFMEAAWRDAAFGVSRVRSDFLSMNQAVYGWSAYTDGYYFNISRALPILGGHGGYDDFGALYFNPSWFLEFGRARDLARPNWYLPTWYEGTPPMRFRMEQYLSFMNNIQGMMKPPDMQVHRPARSSASEGILETNKLFQRLGPIFTTMPPSRPPVAVLYAMSQNLRSQAKDRSDNYEGGGQRNKMMMAYLAGKAIHQPLFPVVEEDVLDGSFAAHHQAVLLAGTTELDERVIRALEEYIAGGGKVLLSDDCKVAIKGAQKVGAAVDTTFSDTLAKLWKENKQDEIAKFNTVGNMLKSNEAFTKALAAKLIELKIEPWVRCDNPGVVVSRQGGGDIEYVFAVNTTFDAEVGERMALKATEATLTVGSRAKHVYDAVRGGKLEPTENDKQELQISDRFGPGQMRVYAVSSEPFRLALSRPQVRRDYTVADSPLAVEAAASIMGLTHMLSGSVPLEIKLIDPHGRERYDIYRATENGVCQITLPLAANDPSGIWRLRVRELLGNDDQTLAFELDNPASCGAAAGTVARALTFGNDRDNIYRFFRTWKDVTIVKGSGDYGAAVERLTKSLAPWGVKFKVMNAADVKPRELSSEEATTWVGLEPGKAKAGKDNPPGLVGFDVRGAVLLLGTPEDNPVIAFLEREKFLPYKPAKGVLPGVGRGYLAWQRDAVGYDQESVTLIAHDAEGIAEACGTLAEIAAGMRPLTAAQPPLAARVEPVYKRPGVPEPTEVWEVRMPDRVVAINQATILSADGTVSWQNMGDFKSARLPATGESWVLPQELGTVKLIVGNGPNLLMLNPVDSPTRLAGKINLLVLDTWTLSNELLVGTVDGRIQLLTRAGKQVWSIDTKPDPKAPNHYLSGVLVPGHSHAVLANSSELHIIDMKEHKIIARLPGVNGKYGVQLTGGWVIATDGNTAKWLSLKSLKFEQTMALPPGGLARLEVLTSGTLLAATEDGAVRLLVYVGEGKKPDVAWEHRAPHRVPKFVQRFGKDETVIVYWGGLVHLLDIGGKLRAARQYKQEVTAIYTTNDRVRLGFADGRVIAVK
jgi:hypothetical protein